MPFFREGKQALFYENGEDGDVGWVGLGLGLGREPLYLEQSRLR